MNTLCKYNDIFGKPNEGLHAYRIFDIAIIDCVFTIIFAIVISYYSKYNILYILLLLFAMGIIFHRIFCVKTTIDKILFE